MGPPEGKNPSGEPYHLPSQDWKSDYPIVVILGPKPFIWYNALRLIFESSIKKFFLIYFIIIIYQNKYFYFPKTCFVHVLWYGENVKKNIFSPYHILLNQHLATIPNGNFQRHGHLSYFSTNLATGKKLRMYVYVCM